jgi:hypothetical protein
VSGWRRTTSRACVPTEPVEPRMTTSRMRRGYPLRARKYGRRRIGRSG